MHLVKLLVQVDTAEGGGVPAALLRPESHPLEPVGLVDDPVVETQLVPVHLAGLAEWGGVAVDAGLGICQPPLQCGPGEGVAEVAFALNLFF